MKNLVNIRIPVLTALTLTLGISVGYLFYLNSISFYYAFLILPLFILILIACLIFKRSKFCIAVAIIIPVAFILGFINITAAFYNFDKSKVTDDREHLITGTIQDKGITARGEYLILKNATLDGQVLDGNIIAYIAYNRNALCDSGYKVKFVSEIRHNKLLSGNQLSFSALQGVKYTCNVYSSLYFEYGFDFFASLRAKIRKTIYDNTDNEIAPVAFAMLTGYTADLNSDLHKNFKYGGISHIFAVSGLHVGILYGLVYFVLRRLPINKFLRVALCLSILFFYIGLCGFTLSSVRAGIMCSILSLTKLLQYKYDGFNALAFAAIFITAINPFNLFDLGFQLSVCAVMGILILKLPRKTPNIIRVPFAAQSATMPILISGFGYMSGAGLILNIIIVPLLSVLFSFLFISTFLATIFPFLGFLLTCSSIPLEAVVSFFVTFGFEKSLISFNAGIWIPIAYSAIFIVSDKINLPPYTRCALFVVLLTVIVGCIALGI